MMKSFLVARPIDADLCFDELYLHECGLIQVYGWQRHGSTQRLTNLSIRVNGVHWAFFQSHRYLRPDVPDTLPAGICIEADVGGVIVRSIELAWEGATIFTLHDVEVECGEPHYHHLRNDGEVLGREGIYGFGPPNTEVHPEVAALAEQLRPPVLDFGCGIGAMIHFLQSRGIEAKGIEIDRPGIAGSLPAEMRPLVTLYDGAFPLPFADKAFESVICSEVLEHIPNYETAVSEMARICRNQVFITVPDISVIPLLHKHNVVPWHLLESTHVNFFNQTSLERLLRRHFRSAEFYRLSACCINGTPYRESLAVLCAAT